MSKKTELMAVVLIMGVVVFGIFILTLADTRQDDRKDPEITNFEETGVSTYFADEDDEQWEITKRENKTAVVEGLIVSSIFVKSLSLHSVERHGGYIMVEINVNKLGEEDTVMLNSGEMTDSKMLTKSLRFPEFGYGYKFSVKNIQPNEDIIVRKINNNNDTADDRWEDIDFRS